MVTISSLHCIPHVSPNRRSQGLVLYCGMYDASDMACRISTVELTFPFCVHCLLLLAWLTPQAARYPLHPPFIWQQQQGQAWQPCWSLTPCG